MNELKRYVARFPCPDGTVEEMLIVDVPPGTCAHCLRSLKHLLEVERAHLEAYEVDGAYMLDAVNPGGMSRPTICRACVGEHLPTLLERIDAELEEDGRLIL